MNPLTLKSIKKVKHHSKGIFIEFNQDDTHIIASKLLLIGILAQHPVKHLLQNLLRPLPPYPLLPDQSDQVLTISLVSLPNTVTAHEDKIVLFAQLHHLYIRMACYRLSLVWQIRVFLVVQVAQTSRKVQVVIDPTTLDLVPRCNYPLQFYRVFRLVVVGKLYYRSQSTQSSPRVSRIGHIQCLSHQKRHIGRAPHRISNFTILKGLQSVLNGYILQQFLPMLRAQHLVQIAKSLLEGPHIVPIPETGIALQNLGQLLSAKLRDLHAAVPIEDRKQKYLLADPVEKQGVLHVLSPACVGKPLPCISQVITRSLPCWYLQTFLVVTGWERNAPPIDLIIKIINLLVKGSRSLGKNERANISSKFRVFQV